MKMKNLILTIAATFGMTALTMAQNVPNYVPTNGLVGWWPFNGNANDESGNGDNGITSNISLTTDRFGILNSAYYFSRFDSYIELNNSNVASYTISAWINDYNINDTSTIFRKNASNGTKAYEHYIWVGTFYSQYKIPLTFPYGGAFSLNPVYSSSDSVWHHVVVSYDGLTIKQFVDGVQISSGSPGSVQGNISSQGNKYIGGIPINEDSGNGECFKGKMDDVGFWNRALTQQEITDLYNATNCTNNTTITPQINSLTTGSSAFFSATTLDPNPSYVWQSDFGQGFQTLNNFGNYSGTNTATLNVSNVQLSEHNQPIRVITTSGNCIDTSNVAIISISDTCINTIIDTTLITVTDTLLINITITGLNPPNNANTIKMFPNPTNDHITIDYGNFSVMNGYQLKIENSIGQQVFQTNISQQSDYLNLTTWGGNGLYFVHIIDTQGNTIDIRKIVLQ
jgi:hypothetical protein